MSAELPISASHVIRLDRMPAPAEANTQVGNRANSTRLLVVRRWCSLVTRTFFVAAWIFDPCLPTGWSHASKRSIMYCFGGAELHEWKGFCMAFGFLVQSCGVEPPSGGPLLDEWGLARGGPHGRPSKTRRVDQAQARIAGSAYKTCRSEALICPWLLAQKTCPQVRADAMLVLVLDRRSWKPHRTCFRLQLASCAASMVVRLATRVSCRIVGRALGRRSHADAQVM